ncbi:MAG: toll/interleukin-1 receptor domain-containing protein, partial [Clostridiales bacterium]|nr:toll/interleukin-1 receptor domain-containing protein [Clostridiales bacterium]
MGYDVFISYRHDFGSPWAQLVCTKLQQDGYSVFWDEKAILAGDFTDYIKSGIESCDYFVVILSKDFFNRCNDVKNDIVRMELQTALESSKKRTIIPIFIDEYKNIISIGNQEEYFKEGEFFKVVNRVLMDNGVKYDETKTQYWGQKLKSLMSDTFTQTAACRESLEKHYKKLANECG